MATLSSTGTGYAVANEKHYDAWGKVRYDGGTDPSGQILNPDQRYCGNLGHKYDSTNGLVYMRARYYEAETGRFISEDPAGDGVNWYLYCENNPTNYADPMGLLKITIGGFTFRLDYDLHALGDLHIFRTVRKFYRGGITVRFTMQMQRRTSGLTTSLRL